MQSEVLIDACEHPVDKGNADDLDHGHVAELSEVSQMTSKMTSEKCNEPRSEELCGSGRLIWKAKYNWIEYNTDKHRVFSGP